MQKIVQKLCSSFLVFTLLTSLTVFSSYAQTFKWIEMKDVIEAKCSYTQNELESMIISKIFYGNENQPTLFSSHGESILTGDELSIYHSLCKFIHNLAINGGEASFFIPEGSAYLKNLSGNNLEDKIQNFCSSFKKIYNLAILDHPEDAYWRDYQADGIHTYSYSYSYTSTGYLVSAHIIFSIDRKYRPKDYDENNPVLDNKNINEVINAKQKATNIADKIRSFSCPDTEKLFFIKRAICDMVEYDRNFSAALDNDPWQIVHVFDNNPNTNVVCEGYSKAFQYLCDLVFPYGEPACYCVSGDFRGADGKGGPHMWNIVVLAGENYLVDVTHSDTNLMDGDKPIDDNRTFMVNMNNANITGSMQKGYTITKPQVDITGGWYPSSTGHYTYDDDILGLYNSEHILELEPKDRTYEDFDYDGNGIFLASDYDTLVKDISKGVSFNTSNKNHKATDKNRDGVLDAFDAALMSQMLDQ